MLVRGDDKSSVCAYTELQTSYPSTGLITNLNVVLKELKVESVMIFWIVHFAT